MELKDFDRMTLQPGETLVLRARKYVPYEVLVGMQEHLRRNNTRAVVVAHDFDIMAVQEMQDPGVAEPSPEDLNATQQQIMEAYNIGKIINFRVDGVGDWCDAHRFASPHKFDFKHNSYRLREDRKAP